jgi:probable F420-dependent oxidoreductase
VGLIADAPEERIRMQLGLSVSDAAAMTAQARLAEALGFDYVGCGEHLFFHTPVPSPFVQLAAAAGATERIRLVSTISLLPLYPAALAAKLAATLDQVSHGRFELGVGAGGEFEREFAAVGVDPATRFRRLDEGLELLRRLFSGQAVSYDGEFAQLDDLALDPPPVQPGGPPIWLGGRKDGAIRRAGRFAHTWLPYMVTPAGLAETLSRVRAAGADTGRADAASIRGAIFAFICVDRDGAWARRMGIEAVSAQYQQDFSALADKYLLLGTPAEVVARLREYADGGAEVAVMHVAVAPGERDRVLRTIAEEVLPELRAT